jgi:hypothetical protein
MKRREKNSRGNRRLKRKLFGINGLIGSYAVCLTHLHFISEGVILTINNAGSLIFLSFVVA